MLPIKSIYQNYFNKKLIKTCKNATNTKFGKSCPNLQIYDARTTRKELRKRTRSQAVETLIQLVRARPIFSCYYVTFFFL